MLITFNRSALIWPIVIAVYLKYLLLPTANLAFELYHLFKIDFIYHLYSGFKLASHLFNTWPYQNLTCLLVWAMLFALMQFRANKKTKKLQESV